MEEQSLDIQIPTGRIFKDIEIRAATFLGGPLVAGYTIAENFKVFGEKSKANKAWIIAISATVIIFGGIFLIPGADKFPRVIIPLVYTGIASALVRQFQGDKIKAHLAAGGDAQNWARTILISLIGLAVTIILVVGIAVATFDKKQITENEVDRMGSALIQGAFFDEAQKKAVLLDKVNDSYEISIPIINHAWENTEAVAFFRQLQGDVQNKFQDKRIVVNLCDDNDINSVKKRLD